MEQILLVRLWHKCEVPDASSNVRVREQSGRQSARGEQSASCVISAIAQNCLLAQIADIGQANFTRFISARIGPAGASRATPRLFAAGLLVRQIEPDVKLAQLLCGHLGRRGHHQVFGPLVHREENHLAQVLLAA